MATAAASTAVPPTAVPSCPTGTGPEVFDGLSVPAHASALVLGGPDQGGHLPGDLVRVGDRAECDLARLAARCGPDAAWAVAGFTHESLAAAARGDRPALVTRRLLLSRRQDTGRHKRDLDAELAQLDAHPLLGPLADAMLAARVDVPAVRALLAAHPHEVVVGDTVAATVGLRSPSWPTELGGAAMPNEQLRWVSLEATHAGWRDRRLRRLSRVGVWAQEGWVDPGPYRALAGGPTHT